MGRLEANLHARLLREVEGNLRCLSPVFLGKVLKREIRRFHLALRRDDNAIVVGVADIGLLEVYAERSQRGISQAKPLALVRAQVNGLTICRPGEARTGIA